MKKIQFIGLPVLVLVFSLTLVGCPTDSGDNGSTSNSDLKDWNGTWNMVTNWLDESWFTDDINYAVTEFSTSSGETITAAWVKKLFTGMLGVEDGFKSFVASLSFFNITVTSFLIHLSVTRKADSPLDCFGAKRLAMTASPDDSPAPLPVDCFALLAMTASPVWPKRGAPRRTTAISHNTIQLFFSIIKNSSLRFLCPADKMCMYNRLSG
jgi:hypothetical protein